MGCSNKFVADGSLPKGPLKSPVTLPVSKATEGGVVAVPPNETYPAVSGPVGPNAAPSPVNIPGMSPLAMFPQSWSPAAVLAVTDSGL